MEEISGKPLISIIVPIYNVRDYVCKCVESIQNQTYKNLEIILVDDGSTDGCEKICDRYAAIDNRVVVIHKVNGGLSDARNCGIDMCHGTLIGFVDGDDWVHPQMYEIMVDKLEKENSDIVTCGFEQYNEESFICHIESEDVNIKNIGGADALIDIETPLVVAWNKLYKRAIFDDLRYPLGRLHEDEFLIHRIFKKCNKITVISRALYFYTIRNDSIIANMNEKRINDALDALEDRVNFAYGEKWLVVMPAVIKRYCDYCIDRYYDIINNKYYMDKGIADKLWRAAHDMCMKYRFVSIDDKYIKFAESPQKYGKYINKIALREKRKAKIKVWLDKIKLVIKNQS